MAAVHPPGGGSDRSRDGATGGRLGVGLAGCGRIAELFHLPVLSRHPLVELRAIADRDPSRLSVAQAPADAERVGDLDALLGVPGVEAVVVCLPSEQHAPAARAVLEADRHLYVEKPLALDLDTARSVAGLWREGNRVGAVGFNSRVSPAFADLLCRRHEVGTPVAIRTSIGSARRRLPDWKRSPTTGGGALYDLASHHLDLVPRLLGAGIESVAASAWSVHEEDDAVVLTLRGASGIRAQIAASISSVQEDRIEVYGDRGMLAADRYRDRRAELRPPVPPVGRRERLGAALREARSGIRRSLTTAAPRMEPSFATALDAFVRASLRAGRQVADLDDGVRCAALVDAARESIGRGGAPVVPQPLVPEMAARSEAADR